MNLITPFDPWKGNLCSCPPKHSLSPYAGCGHGCLYCYASSYIRNFNNPRPKKYFIKRLREEIKNLPKGSFVTMANSSDPYLPLEKETKLTQDTLGILKNCDLRLAIVTKSSLILRDLGILKEFNKIIVSLSFTTLKEDLARRLEPYAPLPKQRLIAVEKLSKELVVACRLDPLIYPLNTKEIRKVVKELKNRGVKQIITSTYKAKPDNLKRMIKTFNKHKDIWQDLYMRKGQRTGRYIYLPHGLRKELITEVREISLREGLEFSSCREDFKDLNTKRCDGSSFLDSV